ncbi:MAG TPA: helix-turn-helix domain-containing protein [Thermoanaerobaculia bacterium]|nr:helix-turn-helix domain-containing protein [Thermoanaerobaculia bacterium]
MPVDRREVRAEHGLLRVEQHFRAAASTIGTDVSGPAVIYAEVRVVSGRVRYFHGPDVVCAPRRFAIVIPPGGLVRAQLQSAEVRVSAIAFRPGLIGALPPTAVLLEPISESAGIENVQTLLSSTSRPIGIGQPFKVTALTQAAKAIIDTEYACARLRIGNIAARLHSAAPVLSRSFKECYGLPPVQYRHRVRVMDALLRFAEGAGPLTVSQDVGFDDLGRFYRIFKTVACAPPGPYRAGRSKNAKTAGH